MQLSIPRLLGRDDTSSRSAGEPDVSAEYAFGPAELVTLAACLRARLRDRSRQIGSPDQLRSAIEDVVGSWRADGTVEVRRIPAAVYTQESWHLRLSDVRPEARQLVDALTQEARGVR